MITAIRGNTEVSAYIDRTAQYNRARFDQSATLGKQSAYNELHTFWQEECKFPDWDGYNAYAVDESTLFHTRWFIESLPLGFPLPSIGAEPDGHLTLEWYASPYWTLSVSISPDRVLYYSALLGDRDEQGSEEFWSEVPQRILRLIKEVEGAKG